MDGGSLENLGSSEKWWNSNPSGVIGWSLILFCSIILNGILLFAFLRRPGLRTISNRFVMNLVVSNMVTNGVLISFVMLDSPSWMPGVQKIGCSLTEGATTLVISSTILSVLLIAIDQYLAVVDPLRYRTRIDKLKCLVLIISVWMISIIFSLISALNPNQKSSWLICKSSNVNNQNDSKLMDIFINNSDNVKLNESILLYYGIIYSITFGIIIYLIPFVSVCWIYINIYSAAHNNSKRTRRNGSRPILTTNNHSFMDDYYPDDKSTPDDYNNITKISSLSSIDENIEPISTTSTSQQLPIPSMKSKSSSIINLPTVIFTVGSHQIDQLDLGENQLTKDNVPIAVLKSEYFHKKNDSNSNSLIDNINDSNNKQMFDSYDLIYNNIVNKNIPDNISDINDDEDDEEIKTFINQSELLNINKKHLSVSKSNDLIISTPIVTVTPPNKANSISRVPSIRSTSNYINCLKHRISNGSLFKYREETRAARISAIVIVMGFICWTPYIVVLLMKYTMVNHTKLLTSNIYIITICLILLSTFITPFLFGYRSKRVKRELRKIFCFKKELSYKNNRSLMAKKVIKRRYSNHSSDDANYFNKCNIFQFLSVNKNKLNKDKVQFVSVPDNALVLDTCRSSFSSGATTSTDEC